MPPPRRPSPRRRERRSRSRSHSPRHRRRSKSHSRSRERRRSRSRSAQRRRSPERKQRSPLRRRSPSPRKRSRSPRRRSRSHSPRRRSRSHSPRRRGSPPRSHSPKRRSRSHSPRRRGSPPRRPSPSPLRRPSPSPLRRQSPSPLKRPANSSVKRQGYKSRSASPAPLKKLRDERMYREESPYEQPRSSKHLQSPVRESLYGGKMYADQPSSSRQPLFPAGTSKHVREIDYVTIVEKGPKREKLNKRFETLEQVAQGPFDFEENITIGIHRGPSHIQLEDDEDIEVNYEFNPKTFKMLFPKKDYVKAIFDRDEIKAFHHDDILDEEAYVEKRTISIKPVDKPKSRKYDDELDYKITVGTDREGYGDRRMVHDSRSRPRPSRSSAYEDIPVTVRLDPKPDPRYEKMYREQQRFEDQTLIQEKVHRDPNDLRYNLMRRRSDGDRERIRDTREPQQGTMDARSRIEARRQESRDYPDRRERPEGRHTYRGSPPRSADRKKAVVKADLPDFKNRPENSGVSQLDNLRDGRRSKWGHCRVCDVSLHSEEQALYHVNSEQHYANEHPQRYETSPARQIRHPQRYETSPARQIRHKGLMSSGEPSTGDSLHRLRVDDMTDRKRHRSTDSDFDRRDIKRRSISDDFDRVSDDEFGEYPKYDDLEEQHIDGDTGHYPKDDQVFSGDQEHNDYRGSLPVTEKLKPEPEWKINPTITPKGQSYYEHDNRSRDDMTFWERKQMFLKTGKYPARGFRGARGGRGGITRGRGRGRGMDQGFFKRTVGTPMDEWKHDKFDEVASDEQKEADTDNINGNDIKKDRKTDRKDRRDSKDVKKGKDERSSRKEKDSSSKKEFESSGKKNKENAREQETIRKEEESLQQELKVEVTIG